MPGSIPFPLSVSVPDLLTWNTLRSSRCTVSKTPAGCTSVRATVTCSPPCSTCTLRCKRSVGLYNLLVELTVTQRPLPVMHRTVCMYGAAAGVVFSISSLLDSALTSETCGTYLLDVWAELGTDSCPQRDAEALSDKESLTLLVSSPWLPVLARVLFQQLKKRFIDL